MTGSEQLQFKTRLIPDRLPVPDGIFASEPFEIGFQRLRELGVQRNDDVEVSSFENAHIQTELVSPDSVLPTTYYLLKHRWLYQIRLARTLGDLGINLFDLDKIYYLTEGSEIWGLIPPIVEEYCEPETPYHGQSVVTLQDGAHRTSIARKLKNQPLRCIVISGANPTPWTLPYAVPNPWSETFLLESVPPTKKRYRDPDDPYGKMNGKMRPYVCIFNPEIRSDPRFRWADFGRKR